MQLHQDSYIFVQHVFGQEPTPRQTDDVILTHSVDEVIETDVVTSDHTVDVVDVQPRVVEHDQVGSGYDLYYAFGPFRPFGNLVSFKFTWSVSAGHSRYDNPDRFVFDLQLEPKEICSILSGPFLDRYTHSVNGFNVIAKYACHGVLKVTQLDRPITANATVYFPLEVAGQYNRKFTIAGVWNFISSELFERSSFLIPSRSESELEFELM